MSLMPDLESSQLGSSASFANPLQSTPVGNLANSIANNLPQTYGGTPLRTFLGFIPQAYATAGNATQPTQNPPKNLTNKTHLMVVLLPHRSKLW